MRFYPVWWVLSCYLLSLSYLWLDGYYLLSLEVLQERMAIVRGFWCFYLSFIRLNEPYLVIFHPKKFYLVGWVSSCYLSKFYLVGWIQSCYLSKFYPVGWILSCYLSKFYPVGWILSGPEEIASLNPRLGRLHTIKDSRCLQRCLQCIAWDDPFLKDMIH